MIDSQCINKTSTEWKRINMRSVSHLMGVEFIHDLYNRHDPKINSIRFRHTITIWKDGIVNSFAPAHEWNRLGELLGHQYYTLNPLILKNTEALYKRKREHFHEFINILKRTDLSTLSNEDLTALLVNFQSIALGELYVLNFVQVEHALNTAVKKVIQEVIPDKIKTEEVFMQLIQTRESTASQKEKRALYKIARKWRFLRKFSFYSEEGAKQDIRQHCDKYQYLYSAYGETPKSFESFWTTFREYVDGTVSPPERIIFHQLLSPASKKTLQQINNKKLNVLIPLLVKGGLFRDTNKALLGQSIKYRFAILDEIAQRNIENRENLNFYLLAEITDLLNHGKKLNPEDISSRQKNGIAFTRFEDFKIYTNDILPLTQKKDEEILCGQCASQGTCTGKCKIVLAKEDADKVEQGDIMVAIGTDFDLIEAMYRSAAVITEEGGILSHASVVCREINKPCCIGVKNATRILKDGQRVTVDATRGEITIQ